MDAVHRVNAYVCFCVGICLNSILLWLVAKKSSENLRVYSRVLVQSVIVDTIYLTTSFFYTPVLLVTDGSLLIYGVGILTTENSGVGSAGASHLWDFALYSAWFSSVHFSQYSVLVPFLFRYFILTR